MRFEKFDLIAYGPFTGYSIDLSAGPRRFHLVYGPNESGKTTCMRAIHSLLFGFPHSLTDDYIHRYEDLRLGATLVDPEGNQHSFIRRKKKKASLFQADDKTAFDEAILDRMLGRIDESAFRDRFGLSHDQLIRGAKDILASKGEVGEILFSAGAGIGHLQAIQKQLGAERDELFKPRAQKTVIQSLIKKLDEERRELSELETLPTKYKQLKQDLENANTQAVEFSDQAMKYRREKQLCQAYQKMLTVVPVWRRCRTRLNELDQVPFLDDDFSGRRRETTVAQQQNEKIAKSISNEIEKMSQLISEIIVDESAIRNEREIVSLYQSIQERHTAARDREDRLRNVRNLNRHLGEYLNDLGVSLSDDGTTEEIDEAIGEFHVSEAVQQRIEDLAGDHKQILSQQQNSAQRLSEMQRRLSELDDELERFPTTADPRPLESVLTEMGAPDSLLESLDDRKVEHDDLYAECKRLLSDLQLSHLDLDDAANLPTPHTSVIDRCEESLADSQRKLESANEQLVSLKKRSDDAEKQLRQLQDQQTLPSESELNDARRVRDESIGQLIEAKENAITNSVSEIQRHTSHADHLVDTIRRHHQQVAQRAAAQREINELAFEIERVQSQAASCESELAEQREEWREIWKSCGIEVLDPRTMRGWIANHQIFLDRVQSLRQSSTRLESAQKRIARATNRLASVVQNSMAAMPVAVGMSADSAKNVDDLDLPALYDVATQIRTEQSEAAGKLTELKRRRQELLDDLPRVQSEHESFSARRQQWESEWKSSTATIAGSNDDNPSVISARLKLISKMRADKRERDILLGRIQSIGNDQESFEQRVESLAKKLECQVGADESHSDAADRFYHRMQDAKSSESARLRYLDEQKAQEAKLVETRRDLDRSVAQLNSLCSEAGVKSPDELSEVELLAAEKRRLTEEFRSTEAQLENFAGNQPLDVFAAEVDKQDAIELEQRLAELDGLIAELEPRIQKTQQTVGVLRKELSEIDGGDRAAELRQSIQILATRIERNSQQYAKRKIASLVLRRAIDHYRQDNESPVLKLAGEAFARLTCGNYSELRPDYGETDQATLEGISTDAEGREKSLPVQQMSLGTADAVYLSLRLASLQHTLSTSTPIPVVIDDCLIQLDDDRTIAALQLLSELSETTQVILFTHHEHLITLANENLRKDDVHIHRLNATV